MSVGEVILPWPPRCLWPNERHDRRSSSGERAAYKQTAWGLALEARLRERLSGGAPLGLHLTIIFHPPDNRKRDRDNMLAAIKAGLDGIQLAVGIDDSSWEFTLRRGEKVKSGAVRILVDPLRELPVVPWGATGATPWPT